MTGPQQSHDAPLPTERVRLFDADQWAWRQRGPTPRAMRAFGVYQEALRRLPGGQGHAWTDGRLVLKPVGCAPEHSWVCEVYAAWDADDVRVPEPVVPHGDDAPGWSADGWGAHVFVPGRDVALPSEMAWVKEASDAFHLATENLPRPDFIDTREDPWAFGDRIAWEAAEPEGDDEILTVIGRLRRHQAPVASRGQVIHGDILPNVLLADGLPPAVIDWPPYYRPVGLATAIAVTDAVTFREAPLALLDEWKTGEDWNQLLVRALLYRLGTTAFFTARNRLMGSLVTHLQRARPVIDVVLLDRGNGAVEDG
ncbi:MAG: aminoglycoside phosphotransferase family protein [Actinomycetota bacterium]|nr:aminoglycoside phosphotransferase family protein [Actinomycetota bacterium]